ncbi:unnamed protein product, partial [Adineta ricciae]
MPSKAYEAYKQSAALYDKSPNATTRDNLHQQRYSLRYNRRITTNFLL